MSTVAPAQSVAEVDAQLRALLSLEQWALRDPFSIYRNLREISPVHVQDPIVYMSRYVDVWNAFRDHERFSSSMDGARREYHLAQLRLGDQKLYLENDAYQRRQMVRVDEPEHAALRQLVHTSLTPRVVAAMKDRIQTMIDELLEPFEPCMTVDFIDAFAYRLPMYVIFELCGIPRSQREQVHLWSEDILLFRSRPTDLELLRKANSSHHEFAALIREVLAAHRGSDDSTSLLTGLLAAEAEARTNEADLVSTLMVLLFAGHETTTNLIGNGVLAFCRHPEQWQALRDQPDLVGNAVEEVLRFDGPAHYMQRTAKVDVDVRGVGIPAGSTVFLSMGSANRDPEQFEEPDRFDVRRQPGRHLGFGFGIHFCVGSSLARLETQMAFRNLLQRFPDFELADDEPVYKPSANNHGLSRLPLSLGNRRH